METIMKPYRFGDESPGTVLSFLGQFKRARDSNGVLEGVARWLLLFSMAEVPPAPLTIRLIPWKDLDVPAIVRGGIEGEKYLYVRKGGQLSPKRIQDRGCNCNSCLRNQVLHKVPQSDGSTVCRSPYGQSATVWGPFLLKTTKSIFLQGLPLNVWENMRMFWRQDPQHYSYIGTLCGNFHTIGW